MTGILGAVIGTATSSIQNLVPNPSFETTDLSNWFTGQLFRVNTDAHTGSWSAYATYYGEADPNATFLYGSSIPMSTAKKYSVSFWIKNGGSTAAISIFGNEYTASVTSSIWSYVKFENLTNTFSTTLSFNIYSPNTPGSAGYEFFLDDVCVNEGATVLQQNKKEYI